MGISLTRRARGAIVPIGLPVSLSLRRGIRSPARAARTGVAVGFRADRLGAALRGCVPGVAGEELAVGGAVAVFVGFDVSDTHYGGGPRESFEGRSG